MKKVYFIALLLVSLFSFSACGVHKTGAYATYESSVIETSSDGIVIVRARGRAITHNVRGVARTNAMYAAEKQALYDVLFNSILCQNNLQTKTLSPLILEPNAAKKYSAYFTQFFAEKGDWKQFASNAGTRYLATQFSKTKNEYVCDMCVRIDRNALYIKLVNDGILHN